MSQTLQIDDDMMKELKDTKAAIKPTDTLLVVDAMTGQEAASLVKAFNDQADITGAHQGSRRGCFDEGLLYFIFCYPNFCPCDMLHAARCAAGRKMHHFHHLQASLHKKYCTQLHVGAILTKMDGDSRGGAALSVREVSHKFQLIFLEHSVKGDEC